MGESATTTEAQPARGIWRQPDFGRLWAAQSVSLFGSEITALALPLLAAIGLRASAWQMGLLAAAGSLPFLLCSLPAGVWVDRRRRRPLLIAADLARAALLLSIPLAAWLGVLSLAQLAVVAFAAGVFGVLFDVAHYAYVPALVGRDRVVAANSKLQISYSAAEAGGPGVAGLLVQAVSAPAAIAADAVSFLVSAFLLRRIAAVEPAVERPASSGTRQEIADGLRALLGHPLLRPIVLGSIADGVAVKAIAALFVLYATRDLGIGPVALGAIFMAGGAGAIPGALLAEPAGRRFGVGPTIVGGWFVGAASWLAVPLAAGPFAAPILALGMLIGGMAGTIVNVQ
ncbi:MAG TPA: MFS transporter, partial [Thermomicrobiales bacterium]|nr:MFS transporter [Thermomicrobiales bacterium]